MIHYNKGPLTAFDDQLPVGGKWENIKFSFPPISIKPFPFPSLETSLAIPIPMGFPWDSHGTHRNSRIMHTSNAHTHAHIQEIKNGMQV